MASEEVVEAVATLVEDDGNAELASAVPIFPPRPDAIMTLLTSDDFLPGAQTLLYSVRKHLPKASQADYPPELVVLVTPTVSKKTRDTLVPFCTRLLEIQALQYPSENNNKKIVKRNVKSWNNTPCGLTKLNIFKLTVYDTLLYLDADCLVVKDVSSLLHLGKIYINSEALVAAAPDIFPPDKFHTGVLVVRPNQEVFDDMMDQRKHIRTYDGGDTGFLNAYFSEWHRYMPPDARLPFSCNAKRLMYHCTYHNQPNYWDMAVAPDLTVINYNSSPKPWEDPKISTSPETSKTTEHLKDTGTRSMIESGDLENLWTQYNRRSRNYATKYWKEKKKEEERQKFNSAAAVDGEEEKVPSAAKADPKTTHQLVSKRFKELRREGKDKKDAMEMARAEYRLDQNDKVDVGKQVASMFGLPL
mmetsp:Transcript_10063/g.15519  ORF Transcript_10063/g.15519 Transcript_10063/m.15519 type:complete len:416 (+) Transcript_10063:108-1355(+)